MSVHFQDETRLGLITEGGRKITLKGVKPIGIKQYERKCFYLYGTVSPLTGRTFFVELPYLDGECCQIFMDEFGKSHREGLHILVWDRASCHTSGKLKCPPNVVLLPLPSASPELNPIERFWQDLKKVLKWRVFKDLDELKEELWKVLKTWSKERLKSLTLFPYLEDAINA